MRGNRVDPTCLRVRNTIASPTSTTLPKLAATTVRALRYLLSPPEHGYHDTVATYAIPPSRTSHRIHNYFPIFPLRPSTMEFGTFLSRVKSLERVDWGKPCIRP